jgi:hypothetical protein
MKMNLVLIPSPIPGFRISIQSLEVGKYSLHPTSNPTIPLIELPLPKRHFRKKNERKDDRKVDVPSPDQTNRRVFEEARSSSSSKDHKKGGQSPETSKSS